MVINYRMNAGYIPLDHWVHNEEGGGRNLGEACHIYDLFTYLVNARAANVTAMAIRPGTAYYSSSDNFVASIRFEDGSVANLTYTSMGSGEYPKESMEIFVDGKTIVLDDYKKLSILGARQKPFSTAIQDKGQYSELISFADGVRDGIWPIPLWQQVQATRISLQVEQFLTA
jgi:predicted dehydrogenase